MIPLQCDSTKTNWLSPNPANPYDSVAKDLQRVMKITPLPSKNQSKAPLVSRNEQGLSDATPVGCDGKIFYYGSQEIGKGATSVVYKGYFEVPTNHAAVKRIVSKDSQLFDTEIQTLLKIRHANVVSYFGYYPNADIRSYYIAMEFADLTMEDCRAENPVSEALSTLKKYMRDALEGLHFLHLKTILHRDIKPANILLFNHGTSKCHAKLTDFGLSRNVSSITLGSTSCGKGTMDWMSPEALTAYDNNQKFVNTYGVDVFSMGLTIFYTLTRGKHPFGGKVSRVNNITKDSPDWKLLNDPTVEKGLLIKNVVRPMLAKKPEDRPKVKCIIDHPYFWEPLRSLDFILKINELLNTVEMEVYKTTLDSYYIKYCYVSKREVNWHSLLCAKVEGYVKTFVNSDVSNEQSIVKLVRFIADQYHLYQNLPDSLRTCDTLGEHRDGAVFIAYFLRRIPELVTLMYTTLQDFLEHENVKSLKDVFYSNNNGKHFGLLVDTD